ncbi:MAG: tetratricopeptide repeat protein [Planctomycetales bacterium]|nr:tetratricopeptide repeat protein [Planctomycetales bacterium]
MLRPAESIVSFAFVLAFASSACAQTKFITQPKPIHRASTGAQQTNSDKRLPVSTRQAEVESGLPGQSDRLPVQPVPVQPVQKPAQVDSRVPPQEAMLPASANSNIQWMPRTNAQPVTQPHAQAQRQTLRAPQEPIELSGSVAFAPHNLPTVSDHSAEAESPSRFPLLSAELNEAGVSLHATGVAPGTDDTIQFVGVDRMSVPSGASGEFDNRSSHRTPLLAGERSQGNASSQDFQPFVGRPAARSVSVLEIEVPEQPQSSGRVSAQTTGYVRPTPISPIDAPPGTHAVGQRLSESVVKCETLVRRGAYYSAREEAEQAAVYLLRVLDQHANSNLSEQKWLLARRAMDEAEDFARFQPHVQDAAHLGRLIRTHSTPVLKDRDVTQASALVAAAYYRNYAQQQLNEAALGHPWASELYYALGRTYQAQADNSSGLEADKLRQRALIYFEAAAATDPKNSLAANQLGFILLQLDRPQEALKSLALSIDAKPSAAGYQNLIEAARRLQDQATYQWALANYQALQSQQVSQPHHPVVVEVPQETFIALSPPQSGPAPTTAGSAAFSVPAQTVSTYRR